MFQLYKNYYWTNELIEFDKKMSKILNQYLINNNIININLKKNKILDNFCQLTDDIIDNIINDNFHYNINEILDMSDTICLPKNNNIEDNKFRILITNIIYYE